MISYRTILFGTVAVLAAAAPAMAANNLAEPAARPVVRTPYANNLAEPASRPVVHTDANNLAEPAFVKVVQQGLFELEEALLLIH
jgi:hypothetical protein